MKKVKSINWVVFVLVLSLFTACSPKNKQAADQNQKTTDPLPSWHEGATKLAITDFVSSVTKPGDTMFVEKEDRIATFDNDGTLWNEKPMYIHFEGVFARFKDIVKEKPELANEEPFKSLMAKDYAYFMAMLEKKDYLNIVGNLMGVPYAGLTTDEYAEWNKEYYSTWKHPKYKVGYQNLIYQPMVELIEYLKENDFKVYICTADEVSYLQLYSEELYGIPPEMVMGTSVKLAYEVDGNEALIKRTAEGQYLNNWDGKPRQIWNMLGKKPILAAGNSNGDYHMLEWVAKSDAPHLSLMLYHTDSIREDFYTKHTDLTLPMMKKEGGTVIDMKEDWKTVFVNN